MTMLQTSPPAPGPGLRVTRTAGQGGAALVLIELWQAFGWFGADRWTDVEAAARWPAITAAVVLVIATVQNTLNWWRERQSDAIAVAVVEADTPADDDDPDGEDVPAEHTAEAFTGSAATVEARRTRPRIGPP